MTATAGRPRRSGSGTAASGRGVQVSRAGYPIRCCRQECWGFYEAIAAPRVVTGVKRIDDGKLRVQKIIGRLAQALHGRTCGSIMARPLASGC